MNSLGWLTMHFFTFCHELFDILSKKGLSFHTILLPFKWHVDQDSTHVFPACWTKVCQRHCKMKVNRKQNLWSCSIMFPRYKSIFFRKVSLSSQFSRSASSFPYLLFFNLNYLFPVSFSTPPACSQKTPIPPRKILWSGRW